MPAKSTKFFYIDPARLFCLFCSTIISVLTYFTHQCNTITHLTKLNLKFIKKTCCIWCKYAKNKRITRHGTNSNISNKGIFHSLREIFPYPNNYYCYNYCTITYSIIFEITPAPTVLPPSRIAKRNSSSIAIGIINSADILTLSPGITISAPPSKFITPVTSVVLK